MEYGITKLILGFSGFIEITECEYQLIKTSRQNLLEVLFLEEKFNLFIENYYEYETELLAIASRMMIYGNADYLLMRNELNLISRRIVNLLTTGRMYLDQSVQHVDHIYGKKATNYDIVKKSISIQYDQYLGYRVMEALRNYNQHYGFPIHNLNFSQKLVEVDSSFHLLFKPIPSIDIQQLKGDGHFKNEVLLEIQDIYDNKLVDVRPLIREYVEGICNIQEKIREIAHNNITTWEQNLDDAIEKFQNQYGNEIGLAGLALISKNDNNQCTLYISKTIIERRLTLEQKNKQLINLYNRYASNEIKNDDI
ncbi:MAG: hypothetical protein GX587_01275 [Bacteroidales bacterium]|nr:hypothetical protein [Bacteroidales bacterium]